MHCSKATQYMQLYIDDHLTLTQVRELEWHLSTCSACREDLMAFEDIVRSVRGLSPVVEPADLTTNIMRRVALSSYQPAHESVSPHYKLFRPSLSEGLLAIILASVAMLGVALDQPSFRSLLPVANGNGALSHVFLSFWSSVSTINSGTLMLFFWVFGTVLGIWITLALAGSEMRTVWYQSVRDRLPVW